MTGFSFEGYNTVLIVWGIVWMLFGTGLVYLLHRYFSSESAESDTHESVAPTPKPVESVERELVASGHR